MAPDASITPDNDQAWLASFPETNPNPILEISLEGSILYANPAARRLFPTLVQAGIDHPYLAGWQAVKEQFNNETGLNLLQDVDVNGKIYQQAIYFVAGYGRLRIYGRDITDRKKTEAALQEANAVLQEQTEELRVQSEELQDQNQELTKVNQALALQTALLESTIEEQQDVVLLYDPDMNVKQVNHVFQETYGFDPVGMHAKEIVKRVACRNVDGTPIDWAIQPTPQAVSGNKVSKMRYWVKCMDGSDLVVETSSNPIKVRGQVAGAVTVWHDITYLKHAHDELQTRNELLKEAETKYRELIQYAPVGIYEVDFRKQCFISVNDAMCLLTGYTRDELLRMNPLAILDEPSRLLFRERISRWLAGEQPNANIVYRVLAKDGHEIFAELNVSFTRNEEGRPKGATVIGYDITERQQMVQALRESQDKFATIFEHAPMVLTLTDMPDGKVVDVNRAFEELFGYTKAEVTGHTTLELGIAADTQVREQVFAQIKEQGYFHNLEITYRAKDGKLITLLGNADVVSIGGKKYTLAAYQNITERKQTEERLAFQADIIENVQDAIFAEDEDFRIIYWNQAAEALYGWSQAEALGQNAFKLLRSELGGSQLEVALATGKQAGSYHGEIIHYTKDGRRLVIETQTKHRKDATGRVVSYLVANRDVSERKQMETALRESENHERERASELAAIMDTVPAIIWVSHDAECRQMTGNQYSYQFLGNDPGSNVSMSAPLEERSFRHKALKNGVEVSPSEMPMQLSAATGKPVLDYEFEVLMEDGSLRHLYGNANPLLAADGQPNGAVSAFVDITERKRAEQALAEVNASLEKRVKERTQELAAANEVLAEQRERLQSLSRRLVDVQETERRFIARELHDEAGQSLTSLLLSLGQLDKETDPLARSRQIAALKETTNDILVNLHELAVNLRPASLDHLGLVATLQQFLQTIQERSGVKTQFRALNFEGIRLAPAAEAALFRIVQESVTNVVRHAHASQVDVLIERSQDEVVLIIEDNGLGFEISDPAIRQSSRLGLLGMQERAEMLGGELEIESSAGMGTTIMVRVACSALSSE